MVLVCVHRAILTIPISGWLRFHGIQLLVINVYVGMFEEVESLLIRLVCFDISQLRWLIRVIFWWGQR